MPTAPLLRYSGHVIVAAADGSSLSNPGPAGWAWYIDDDNWARGGWPRGTNNQGELMAVLDLLRQTAGTVEELHLLCDSQYVINSVTKWRHGWKRNGWRKSDNKPVLNVDLIKEIDAEIAGRKVSFEWVKGHAGHVLNEKVDHLAREAATAFQNQHSFTPGPGFGNRRPTTQSTPTPAQPGGDIQPNQPQRTSAEPRPHHRLSLADADPTIHSREIPATDDHDLFAGDLFASTPAYDLAATTATDAVIAALASADKDSVRDLILDTFSLITGDGELYSRGRWLAQPHWADIVPRSGAISSTQCLGRDTCIVRYKTAGHRPSHMSLVWVDCSQRPRCASIQITPIR